MKEESSGWGSGSGSGGYTCSLVGKKRSRMRSTMDEKSAEAPGPCSECGKKFWSLKALFGHMRCHPERHWRGINPPPNARRQQPQPQQPIMTQEDLEVATCLLLLANGNNKDKDKEEDVHQCSGCNKVFGSHQALGGHRSSHKNVKGCFANANVNNIGISNCEFENMNMNMMMISSGSGTPPPITTSTSDGHKCSICLRVFSTGQALGGHKRCHWEKGVMENMNNVLIDSSTTTKSCVDLNLPPPTPTPTPTDPHALTLDLRLGL